MRISDWSSDVCSSDLLSGALLQLPQGSAIGNFVLVTTTKGRILAKRTDQAGAAFEVFDIAAARAPASAQCDAGTQQYGIRSSTKSGTVRSEEHTSELQSLMRISYAVFCLKKKKKKRTPKV